MAVLNVSAKGAIVIPAAIRKKYKIEPLSKVEIVDTGDELLLIPIPDNVIDYLDGILKDKTTESLTEALLEERRKDKEREDRKWKNMF